MFPFDHAALPQLTTRKAFIGVDFQNDFISQDGALPVLEPQGFVDRAAKVATAFRAVGDVVWVQSRFDEPQPADSELIVVNDESPPKARPSSRGRRKMPVETVEASGPPDPEAFLSHEEPACVKPGSPGCDMALVIDKASRKTDLRLNKTHYSAFQTTQLLRVLRAKMVMEVFICGSLTNIGVYATALDAAGHGMAITVIHDCCGFRSETRQAKAIDSLIELTGCEIASYEEVMEIIQPKPTAETEKDKPDKSVGKPSSKRLEPPQAANTDDDARRKSLTPEIVKDMTGLRLASDSPSPANKATQPEPKAPAICTDESNARPPPEAEGSESAVDSQSKAEEDPGADSAKATDAAQSAKASNVAVVEDVAGIKAAVTVSVSEDNEAQQSHHNSSEDRVATPESTPVSTSVSTPDLTPAKEKAMDTTTVELQADDNCFLQKGLCEGDTDIIKDVLPGALADEFFSVLKDEVQWRHMLHQGGEVPRLVAVQGEVADDGSMPVYRHPSDESPPLMPFSPTVLAIKAATEKHLGHALNHVLIQFYRGGSDYISEHSDKTLDIVQGSYIANVSLGAERTMVFRTKRHDRDLSRTNTAPAESKRQSQRAQLPHNSLCRLGLKSNMKWLHAIRQDKRSSKEKSAAELAFDSGRISLTFRQIGTFLNRDETLIWGQGAAGKTRKEAGSVINGQTPETVEMLKAFGTENHATEFNWDAQYGKGFDVLHMSNAPRLFFSNDSIVNNRIALMLAELGINYAKGTVSSPGSSIKFVDRDLSVVQGDVAIALYLDARYGAGRPGARARNATELATQLTRFQQGLDLVDKWRSYSGSASDNGSPGQPSTAKPDLKPLMQDLIVWNSFAEETKEGFIAGPELSLVDYVVWPVLHTLFAESSPETLDGLDSLKLYCQRVAERPSGSKVLGSEPKIQSAEKTE
ncbi:hypothetical protein B0J13DRAFT_313821 [Dactylonectria estremocensis]|uniref:Fe2OG dioxygenase domain-containing protein n=1 Tax=Dactylonectria estremocensis TaxID=1079267 RepID=A0A9P9J8V7_9HYPO|nr:hypothetical protein B0J13DRAFT_313821 [Dactylonectria estremocensis]